MIKKEQDPMGQAMYHYFHYNDTTSIKVNTNITEGEELQVPYLFRKYSEMPFLEKEALRFVKGKVLDVGAGSGAHSLYLQDNGFRVNNNKEFFNVTVEEAKAVVERIGEPYKLEIDEE